MFCRLYSGEIITLDYDPIEVSENDRLCYAQAVLEGRLEMEELRDLFVEKLKMEQESDEGIK